MAVNERVLITTGEITHNQLAPSQSARTMFTPGKISSLPGDENWPKEYRMGVGLPNFGGEAGGPLLKEFNRVVLTYRGSVSDQTHVGLVTGATDTTTITDTATWGTVTPSHDVVQTNTQNVNGSQERLAGNDRIAGA